MPDLDVTKSSQKEFCIRKTQNGCSVWSAILQILRSALWILDSVPKILACCFILAKRSLSWAINIGSIALTDFTESSINGQMVLTGITELNPWQNCCWGYYFQNNGYLGKFSYLIVFWYLLEALFMASWTLS